MGPGVMQAHNEAEKLVRRLLEDGKVAAALEVARHAPSTEGFASSLLKGLDFSRSSCQVLGFFARQIQQADLRTLGIILPLAEEYGRVTLMRSALGRSMRGLIDCGMAARNRTPSSGPYPWRSTVSS